MALLNGEADWYTVYGALVYLVGSLNFVNWVKDSAQTGKHGQGLETTKFLSDYFKLNFYNALKPITRPRQGTSDRAQRYRNAVPLGAEITPEVRAKLNEIEKYPAVDFVGNIYASGSYYWDSVNQEYVYPQDYAPAFEVAAFEPYEFDFRRGIKSLNIDFKWSELKIPNTTKWGGKLIKDGKKVKYIANNDFLHEIDEFDVEIIPDSWNEKPANYVPGYKFKVKIRNVVNKSNLDVYDSYLEADINTVEEAIEKFGKRVENDKSKVTRVLQNAPLGTFNYLVTGRNKPIDKNMVVLKQKLVGPASKTLSFYGDIDDYILIKIDGQTIISRNEYRGGRAKIIDFTFEKDRLYDLEVYIFNKSYYGKSKIWLEDENQKVIPLEDYAIAWNYSPDKTSVPYLELLRDEKYHYHRRYRDTNNRSESQIQSLVPAPVTDTVTKLKWTNVPTNYTSDISIPHVVDGSLKTRYEDWSRNEAALRLSFSEPTVVNNLEIWYWWVHATSRPNWFRITGIDADTNENIVLFEGDIEWYSYYKIWFNKPAKIKEAKVEMAKKNGKGKGIVIAELKFGNTIKSNEIIPFNSINNNFFGRWEIKQNDQQNYSSLINHSALVSNHQDDYLEVDFYGNAFSIVGKSSPDNSTFDVYLDDVLIDADVKTNYNTKTLNGTLYTWFDTTEKSKPHRLKIVNKQNKELTLNYLAIQK
ncbi:hypothetical protein [Mycoplasma nasistruthionis]|uniref:Uncharacterized protein n=1 Tax=Mycoplasma nasistruthionis TaxID=353852 RepID=A0A4Y6I669_9MOLU|nr:hypothetical protein [Mycoplasma nasistruthionis]QDF64852.1 hypothetical protein FIV53_00800 [Mycoplasma nasistruthionis]